MSSTAATTLLPVEPRYRTRRSASGTATVSFGPTRILRRLPSRSTVLHWVRPPMNGLLSRVCSSANLDRSTFDDKTGTYCRPRNQAPVDQRDCRPTPRDRARGRLSRLARAQRTLPIAVSRPSVSPCSCSCSSSYSILDSSKSSYDTIAYDDEHVFSDLKGYAFSARTQPCAALSRSTPCSTYAVFNLLKVSFGKFVLVAFTSIP